MEEGDTEFVGGDLEVEEEGEGRDRVALALDAAEGGGRRLEVVGVAHLSGDVEGALRAGDAEVAVVVGLGGDVEGGKENVEEGCPVVRAGDVALCSAHLAGDRGGRFKRGGGGEAGVP